MLSNFNPITFGSSYKKKLIDLNSITIDSKSGYSGAGKKYKIKV